MARLAWRCGLASTPFVALVVPHLRQLRTELGGFGFTPAERDRPGHSSMRCATGGCCQKQQRVSPSLPGTLNEGESMMRCYQAARFPALPPVSCQSGSWSRGRGRHDLMSHISFIRCYGERRANMRCRFWQQSHHQHCAWLSLSLSL